MRVHVYTEKTHIIFENLCVYIYVRVCIFLYVWRERERDSFQFQPLAITVSDLSIFMTFMI